MVVAIRDYILIWNPKRKLGRVDLRLQTGQGIPIPISSAEEFAAIAAILNESPIGYETVSGDIVTGWEAVGGT